MLPWLVLAAVLALLVVFLATLFSHVRTATPYGGTSSAVCAAMIRLAKLRPGDRVVDIGAGDGRLLIAAARACPRITAVGYEAALGVWLVGQMRSWLSHAKISLHWRDALRQDLSSADVVFLYLGSEMMERVARKFREELRPGTRVVSHFFRLPGVRQTAARRVRCGAKLRTVRLYRWNAPSSTRLPPRSARRRR